MMGVKEVGEARVSGGAPRGKDRGGVTVRSSWSVCMGVVVDS